MRPMNFAGSSRRLLPFIFLGAMLLSLSTAVEAQTSGWQWVNPLPQGNLLNAVWAVNNDTVIAVGALGTILRTTDAGSTWEVQPNAAGSTDELFGVQFMSSTTGWAVGEFGRVLKTTDGGESWFSQNVPTFFDLYSVDFVSLTTGWVAGSQGIVFVTTDGGNTWVQQTTNTTQTFFSVYFRTNTVGWVIGTGGTILYTSNAGATWISQTSGTTQTLYSIQFVSPSIGYASGSFGVLLKTNNGGFSWIPLTSGTDISMYAMQFTSALVGWAFGGYGEIIKTSNGGTSWFPQTSGTENDIFGVAFGGASLGWAVGDYGTILKTIDGANWIPLSNGPKTTIYGMTFSTPSRGYAVGDQGTIIQTTDAGRTWVSENSGTYQPLYTAYFINATTGWAVGDSATILKTTNGGATWNESNTHTDPSLYSIHFPTATNGWAVGDFGTILATTNGGGSWGPQSSNSTATFSRVRFASATTGWVIGYAGVILKTIDGGITWVPQNSGTSVTLDAISVIDQNTAYISGDNGTMLFTSNGGSTWIPQNSNTDASLYGLSFFNSSIGWAAGDYGTIVTTYDGGNTWQVPDPITDFSFFELQCVRGTSGGIVYACGEGGTIIASTVSPLPLRVWTGSFDSLWFNTGNWNPAGVPEKIDSVYIPATAHNPSIRTLEQQVNLGALTIAPNAKLTIAASVASLAVKSNITLLGTLTVEPGALTQIYAGATFSTQFNGVFNPGRSTLIFTGPGTVKGTFNDVILSPSSAVQSLGNVTINHSISVLSNFYLRSSDTLFIANGNQGAFEGPGIVSPGTILRTILPGATFPYRFESELTYLRFYPQGTLPSTVAMTVYPNSLPAGLADSIFVRRYYSVNPVGGSNYEGTLSLRYDSTETNISIDNLALFRDSSGIIFNMGSSDFVDSDLVSVSLDSVQRFSQWYLGRWDYFPRHPFQFTNNLIIQDNGAILDTLTFGAQDGATAGIDSSFGEVVLGPVPPAGTYDVRWQIATTNGTLLDFLPYLSTSLQQQVWPFTMQPGPGGYPMTIHWDSTQFCTGSFFLRDQTTHGGQLLKSMKLQQYITIPSSTLSALEIYHTIPTFYSFGTGWNMVSLPLIPTNDGRKITTFPAAGSEAFGYAGAYYVADTLHRGAGYWIKFAGPQSVGFEGLTKSIDTINVTTGWNLIGAGSKAIAKASIGHSPSTSVISNYFQFSGGYVVSDTLKPASGYWVKVSGNGYLVLTSAGAPKQEQVTPVADLLARMNSVAISDKSGGAQVLYFGRPVSPDLDEEQFSLPPPPPAGSLDARFGNGGMLALAATGRLTSTIRVESPNGPATVRWHIAQRGVRDVRFTDSQGKILASAGAGSTDGTFIITRSSAIVTMEVDFDAAVPSAFALHQNYPNPFNPTTQIAFDLPEDARVSITIYNLLGQIVATLADNQAFPPGMHALAFDGGAVSSGVYFYRMMAQGADGREFNSVRKMLLIR